MQKITAEHKQNDRTFLVHYSQFSTTREAIEYLGEQQALKLLNYAWQLHQVRKQRPRRK